MRVSIGSFSPEQADEVERLLEESEHSLRPAMATLPEMLALRDTFQTLGVRFQPIANLDVLWRL